jgi:hypothetical protein
VTLPISEFHASTIVEVKAGFGFVDFVCDPDEITRTIGIEPDEVSQTGDTRVVPDGRTFPVPLNSWWLQSRSQSKDVNDHLRELLARLNAVADRIRQAFGTPSFSVTWKSRACDSGPYYEPDVLAGIARMNANLFQDIYRVD